MITDHLCASCREHYDAVKEHLGAVQISFTEEPRLVRGLDYYTRTAFEFVAGGLGSQDAVGGGGRYDGLAEVLGGPHVPGIGFALGLDRIMLSLGGEGCRRAPGDRVHRVSRRRRVAMPRSRSPRDSEPPVSGPSWT